MNKQNRIDLQRAIDLINEANEIISTIKDEEDEKFNNMTEGLQQTERGQKMEENVSELDNVFSNLEDVIGTIEQVME